MGKEATPSKLLEYWILPVACTFFTLLSLLYAFIGVRLLNMPEWLYPAAAFPNMLSLPLLMAQSLAKTGSLDKLLNGPDDTVEDALDRAKVYFLVSVSSVPVYPYVYSNAKQTGAGWKHDPLRDRSPSASR